MVKRIGKLSVNVITEKESLLKRGFISESDAKDGIYRICKCP